MQKLTVCFSLLLGACATESATSSDWGALTMTEQERLLAAGVDDLVRDGDHVWLYAGDREIGSVWIFADGYDVELAGTGAAYRQGSERIDWSCTDGRSGTSDDPTAALPQLVSTDPELAESGCLTSLAAGWFVSGAFKAAPAGCERVVVGDEARLRCGEETADAEVGRSEAALCLEDFAWVGDESCLDYGSGCSAGCWSCDDGWGFEAGECGGGGWSGGVGGGGGGGGGGACGRESWDWVMGAVCRDSWARNCSSCYSSITPPGGDMRLWRQGCDSGLFYADCFRIYVPRN